MLQNTTIDSQKLKQKAKNIAYKYLAKYSTSKNNLAKHLLKKMHQYYKAELIENEPLNTELQKITTEVINYLVDLGYLNDATYTKQQSIKFIKSGKSYLHISYKLKEKGVSEEQIKTILNYYNKEDVELLAALKYLKKKSFGAYRKKNFDDKQKNKEINALGRNGFNFETINKVLKYSNAQEIDEIINKLQKQIDD